MERKMKNFFIFDFVWNIVGVDVVLMFVIEVFVYRFIFYVKINNYLRVEIVKEGWC